jgi:hypothetical protein
MGNMMQSEDHVVNERVHLNLFGYVFSSEERPQTCRELLKSSSMQTAVFMFLHVFK